MNDPAVPDNLASRLAEIEGRIRNLETSPRLLSSSIRGGAVQALDNSGAQIALIGQIGGYGNGLLLTTPTGQTEMMVTDTAGIVLPYLGFPWRKATEYYPVTSATFADLFQARIEAIPSLYLRFSEWIGADASTTGEVRLVVNGSVVGSTITIAAGTTVRWEFSGLHGATLNSGPIEIAVQGRRTSGAGNVNVWEPSALTFGAAAANGGGFPTPVGGWH